MDPVKEVAYSMHYWQRKTQAVNPLGCRIVFAKRETGTDVLLRGAVVNALRCLHGGDAGCV